MRYGLVIPHKDSAAAKHQTKTDSDIILVDRCPFMTQQSAHSRTCSNIKMHVAPGSRGTKVEKMLTLAPERYTAGFCMVAKVILWCI